MTRCLLMGLGFACMLSLTGFAQEQTPLPLTRLTTAIQLDGRLDDPAWQTVQPLPLTMYLPVFEGTPTEQTEIRVAYDQTYLYAAGRFYDTDPQGIRANSLYRDRQSGDDLFGLIIDTFNDNENALWFATTPTGVRIDQSIANDHADYNDINPSWNTFWDVVTSVDDAGWTAEIRIPFSSLRFQNEAGRITMGLTATRYIARKNEQVTFPAIPVEWPVTKPSAAQDVTLERVVPRTPVYVTPYVRTGTEQTPRLQPASSDFSTQTDFSQTAGLDVKYNLTPNITLDITANTDFAQVEADDEQINLTRFSLFFPEKRAFFQERAGVFDFRTVGADRLFHSRQIGLAAGQPVPIIAGTRLVGRIGAWDIGAINIQTARQAPLPSENFGVLRLRRQIINPFSYAGGLVTSRLDADGGSNVAYGFDSVIRVFGNDYFTAKWMQSFDADITDQYTPTLWETSQAFLMWQRRVQAGFNYKLEWAWTGRHFEPALGFVRRPDTNLARGIFVYSWLLDTHPFLRALHPSLLVSGIFRHSDGALETGKLLHWWTFETKNGGSGWIEPRLQYEDVPVAFNLSRDVEIPVGSYTYFDWWLNYVMPAGRLLRAVFDAEFGPFYDGFRTQLTVSPTWNASRFLEIGGRYGWTRIDFDKRDQHFLAHLLGVRVQAAWNAKGSAQAFVQYNTVAERFSFNVRLRYNLREGNDLWLVFNEGLNTVVDRPDVPTPRLAYRTVLLKYTHTFAL